MKLTENTKVRIKVPKHLYEAIQAELAKKHEMEEMAVPHDGHDKMEEAELEEDLGIEMALKQVASAISGGDPFFALVGLTFAIAGTVIGAANAPQIIDTIKAFYQKFGEKSKKALAKIAGKTKNPEIKAALQNPDALVNKSSEPTAPVDEVEEVQETLDLESLMEAVKDQAKKKAEEKKKKEAEDKKKKEAEAKKKADAKKKK